MILRKGCIKEVGVFSWQRGAPVSVLDMQAFYAFAGCSEQTLKDTLAYLKKPVPEEEEGLDTKTVLQLSCLAAKKPDITDREAAMCLHRGFILESPDVYAEVIVDPDILGDVVEKTEAKEVQTKAAQFGKARAKKDLVCQTRDKISGKYFKKTPAAHYNKTVLNGPKWVAAKDKENTDMITKFIQKHSPVGPVISLDEGQGRWRVISENLDWKSISWTRRGYEKAACMTIRQAWNYHMDCTGEKCPFDLNALAKRFADEISIA